MISPNSLPNIYSWKQQATELIVSSPKPQLANRRQIPMSVNEF